jgi:putative iron-only hydrogenase system regulator
MTLKKWSSSTSALLINALCLEKLLSLHPTAFSFPFRVKNISSFYCYLNNKKYIFAVINYYSLSELQIPSSTKTQKQSDPMENPTEKRIGAIIILVKEKHNIQKLNVILSNYGAMILGRQGIPVRDKGISIISLVIEGTNDEISTLSGQLGRLEGITSKAVIAKE